jgi:hypothetical protein
VVPAKGRSSAARRGEATARHRAAWRRWPVGVALQDEGKRGECGEAMADTLCAGGRKGKESPSGGSGRRCHAVERRKEVRSRSGVRNRRARCSAGDRQNRGAHGGSGTGEKLGPAAGPVVLGQPNVFALIRLKDDPPILKNFQVKYGSVGNYIRNNFAYGNFLKFRIEFELKIREGSSC